MSFLRKTVFLGLVLIIFYQCRKPSAANWDVDMVFPVVNSKLNIRNFLGDTLFKIDNAGLLSLSINEELTAIKLDTLLQLPDTTIVKDFFAFFPTYLTPGQSLTFFPAAELTFNIDNGVALKKTDIRQGVLNVKFSNSSTQPLDLIYKITSATKSGQTFQISETVPPGNKSLIKSYSLAGYALNLRGISGNLYNTIVQTYTVSLNQNAQATTINFGQGAAIEVSYSNIVPDYVEGYFGQQTIAIPSDTTKIDLLNEIDISNFMLADASLNFKIFNEFGAEFSSDLSNIKSISTKNNNFVMLNSASLSNINVNRATKTSTTIFPSIKTISLVPANSNILPFLSNLPNKLTYQGSVKVNPLGNISGYNDFAFYNTGIKVLAEINIPMRFNANYFKLVSNTKVDFSKVTQLDNVNSGRLVLNAINGYPFSADVQVYLLDETGLVTDSLFAVGSNLVEKGNTDAQYIVTSPKTSKIYMPLNTAKLEKLKSSKTLRITSKFFLPPGPPPIQLFDKYMLDINVVAELNYNVSRN
jgi:hypothetical protein